MGCDDAMSEAYALHLREVAKLKARALKLLNAADAGPWVVCPMDMYVMLETHGAGGMVFDSAEHDHDAPPNTVARARGAGRDAPQDANLALIAAAPTLIAELIKALDFLPPEKWDPIKDRTNAVDLRPVAEARANGSDKHIELIAQADRVCVNAARTRLRFEMPGDEDDILFRDLTP